MSNDSLSFSSSDIKFGILIQPIANVLSLIFRIDSLDLILLSIITNHIFITWVINPSIFMWDLPLNYSRIIDCHTWLFLLKSTRPCSNAPSNIIWLGDLLKSTFMINYYETTFKISSTVWGYVLLAWGFVRHNLSCHILFLVL